MRIERLLLERFGHFEDFELDFGTTSRLHVVFGPNEAGKSTLLAAIGDLLFGMPPQTPYNFRHPYGALRVGARIVTRDGVALEFKRRKARTHAGTLLTLGAAEAPLQDDALAPLLGGADRPLFERMFGLDHQRLRAAGERMILSEGDLGQALFEAGSGVDSLNRVLGDLGGELDALGTPGQKASRKPLWRAVEEFGAAGRDARAATLKVDEVRAAERRVADAARERERIASELADVRRRKGLLERMRRTGPVIADLDRLSADLDAVGDAPELPPTFEADWAELAKAAASGTRALELAASRLEVARADLEARPGVVAYGSHEAVAAEMREQLGRHRRDIATEPTLARDLAAAEEGIAARLRALGRDPKSMLGEGIDPRASMPTAAEMARARGAVQAAVAAAARREEASRTLSGLERELAVARVELAACDGASDPTPAAALMEQALALGDAEAEALAARLAAAAATRAGEEAVARLPGWGRGAEALASCPFPDRTTVASLVTRLADVASERDAIVARIEEGRGALVETRSRLVGLRAGGEIPTVAAVAATRDHRDERWRTIRDAFVGSSRPDAAAVGGQAAAFEAAVRRADDLVDRREAEAQRVATAAELRATEVGIEGRIDVDERLLAGVEACLRSIGEQWTKLWSRCGVAPDAPGGAMAWLAAKDDALRALAAAREASARADRAGALALRATSLEARAAVLLGLRPEGSADEGSRPGVGNLRAALSDHRSLWSRAQAATVEVARCVAKRDEAERSLADLAAADAARIDEWSSLSSRFGWRPMATIAEAEAVLVTWEGMAAPLSERETARRRLADLRRDDHAFRSRLAEVEAILVGLAGPMGDGATGDPEAVLRRLEHGLSTERAALARRAEAGRAVEASTRELEAAREALASASSASAAFRRLHGLSPEVDCVAVGQRATAARQLRALVGRRRLDLVGAGEGLGEAALRAEADGTSPEAAAAEVAGLGEREDALVEAGQVAAQTFSSAAAALAEIHARVGGVDARGRERVAALAFGGHAERWLVLATARGLLTRAVERYRALNQHPMVARAGEIMADLTAAHANPIERLSAEYRDKRRISLVGIRRDGSSCEIANMTEGTRDQVFLGLRIAAFERHAQGREPLPFVADDLFITSDDERTACGLRALATLAETTQVILFTHHLSVLRSAEAMAASHGVATHVLPGRPDVVRGRSAVADAP
jgi:uncharacterized protein YhaN